MKEKKIIYVIIGIISVVLITIGVTYAYWILTREQTIENVVKTACLDINMVGRNDILLEKAYPILDEEGLKLKPYTFTITNNCEDYANYEISLEMLSETNLDSEYVKIALNESGDKGVPTNLKEYGEYKDLKISGAKEGRTLKTSKLKPNEEKEYELRIWIDEDVTVEDDVMNKTYQSKIVVESELGEKPYTESILKGTDPVLDGDLIPITINEENGQVTRADETKKWYSYAEQKWANAVILRNGVEDPGPNEPIEESDIESYFVWIPRYRYEIFTDEVDMTTGEKQDKTKIINVEFESKDEAVKSGTTVGEWLTHPAFTAFNTNGIWVGKFETGYDGAGSTGAAQLNPKDEEASIEAANKVIIKPNVYSWRGIQVAKAYTVGRHYEATLNSHLMKNTEWGAVAYLQHSQYGSHVSVRINNNSSYLTGYAAKNEPTIGYTGTNRLCSNTSGSCNEYGGATPGSDGEYNTNYFNKVSVVASTTNNYTGVYDMAGGASEIMMAGMDDNTNENNLSSGRHNVWNSGFNGVLTCPTCNNDVVDVNPEITRVTNGIDLPTDERYYDKYAYDTNDSSYKRSFLGDAVKEMGPFLSMKYETQTRQISSWYDDEAWFVNAGFPWLMRGGNYVNGTGSGIFELVYTYGAATVADSFRLVLAF